MKTRFGIHDFARIFYFEWPSEKDFVKYGRLTAIAPVKISVDTRGQPILMLDVDEKFRDLYRDP